jgi:thiosulfate dehydrogenase
MHSRTLLLTASVALSSAVFAEPPAQKTHDVPTSADGDVVVGLCDGKTSIEVQGVKDASKIDRKTGQKISDALMAEWKQKNPKASWDAAPVKVAQAKGSGESAASGAQEVKKQKASNLQDGHTYGAFSARDEAVWKASAEEAVKRGHQVFHDAKELGGTVAISCDMCHPDASNTHPETYPKYQVQLGRVALLRDMINWCIENPVRGKPLAEDDPRMKAMEAYIYAQRKGVKLEYGKH